MKIISGFYGALLALGIILCNTPGSLGQDNQEHFPEKHKSTRITTSVFEGFIVAGYVDGGGFTNFTGPNINISYGNSKYILSALPSLKYKRDTSSETRNTFITPNLGIGFTYSYKLLAIQVPLYYSPKTPTNDGRWHMGIGIGCRINYL